MHLEWQPANGRATAPLRYAEVVRSKNDHELAANFVADCRGSEPTESERTLLDRALRAVTTAEVAG